jgi:N-acetyl sugar amidotransferase
VTRRTAPEQFEVSDVIRRRSRERLVKGREIRRCAKCLMTETEQTLTFDEKGVCNICQAAAYREDTIDWDARERELREILERHRGKRLYDALVPFSGGKDSAWVAYVLVRRYKLKVLLVTFNSNFRRPTHLENIERVTRALGCDHVTFKAGEEVIRKTMVEMLKRKGDFCWYCHTGVVAFPFKAALMYRIPLLIWGEPSSEYAGGYYGYKDKNPADERWFNRTINLSVNAEDIEGFLGGEVDLRDLEPFRLPPRTELEELGLESIHLGDYIKWDAARQIEILNRELGWEPTETENLHPRYAGEKIECFLQGSRDYLRYIKRGYSRTNQRANLEIRLGRITREEAEKMIRYDAQRPASLDVVLKYLGIDDAEFHRIAENHAIYPHVHDPDTVRQAQKKLDDHEMWAARLEPPTPKRREE